MERFIYFDHNIFNRMVRGDEEEIRLFYEPRNLIPVFSDENIDEIDRSIQRRESFFDLLDRMGARHIGIPLDEKFNHKGILSIAKKSAHTRSLELADARAGFEDDNDMLDFMTKAYGGLEQKTFCNIISSQLDEAEKSMRELLIEIDPLDECMFETRSGIIASLKKLPQLREELSAGLGEMGVRLKDGSLFEQLQQELGITSMQLGNTVMPNVVDKLWNLVGHKFGGPELSIIDYLDKIDSFTEDVPNTQPRSIQLINGVYNWLNMIGFCRDEGLKKPKRMKASFGDMTHAGFGSACEVFLCNDQKMRRKIEATYEYLKVECDICAYEGRKTDALI